MSFHTIDFTAGLLNNNIIDPSASQFAPRKLSVFEVF